MYEQVLTHLNFTFIFQEKLKERKGIMFLDAHHQPVKPINSGAQYEATKWIKSHFKQTLSLHLSFSQEFTNFHQGISKPVKKNCN